MIKITKKGIVYISILIGSIIAYVVLTMVSASLERKLYDQHLPEKWSRDGGYAQISCYYSAKEEVTDFTIQSIQHSVESSLQEASITTENDNARLIVDCYSAKGEVTLTSGKTSLTASALGVGGDFFLFHPVEIINGAYFSGNALMKDYIIIDEDAAWQLFGSNDVVGMQVEIGGVPHLVAAVIKRDDDKLSKAAGLDKTLVYLSYESLEAYGTSKGISAYEILMPNPVKGFAYDIISKKVSANEDNVEVIDNSIRFNDIELFGVIKEFSERVMSKKDIIYPYWENKARAVENQMAVLLIFRILVAIPGIVVIIVGIVKGYSRVDGYIKKKREKRYSYEENY